jgi:hypothetical protein
MVHLAERVSPDHHSQGALLAVMLLVAVVFFRSWPMAAACLGFFAMHFCYGGSGTFQKPLREGADPSALDMAIVFVGMLCLTAYVALGLYEAFLTVAQFVRWTWG